MPVATRSKNNPYAPAEHLAEVSKDMLFLHDKAYRLVEVRVPALLCSVRIVSIFAWSAASTLCRCSPGLLVVVLLNEPVIMPTCSNFHCGQSQRSPNDGAKLAAVLKRLLSRETRFISWKALACPEIEISRPVLSEEGIQAQWWWVYRNGILYC